MATPFIMHNFKPQYDLNKWVLKKCIPQSFRVVMKGGINYNNQICFLCKPCLLLLSILIFYYGDLWGVTCSQNQPQVVIPGTAVFGTPLCHPFCTDRVCVWLITELYMCFKKDLFIFWQSLARWAPVFSLLLSQVVSWLELYIQDTDIGVVSILLSNSLWEIK